MRKKLCVIILAALSTCLILSACGKKDDIGLEYKIYDGEYAVYSYADSTTRRTVVVPDEFDGKKVTTILRFGIANAESLVKLTIGKNIKNIEGSAIVNNKNLFRIEVHNDNEYFTAVDGVLYTKDKKQLVAYPARAHETYDERYDDYSVKIPESAEINQAYTCEIDVPSGVESLRERSFYKVNGLTQINFPESLRTIGDFALFDCNNLRQLKLPDKLEIIGAFSFFRCHTLKEITIPRSVVKIGEAAFFDCKSVEKCVVKNSPENIELGDGWEPGDTMGTISITWEGMK